MWKKCNCRKEWSELSQKRLWLITRLRSSRLGPIPTVVSQQQYPRNPHSQLSVAESPCGWTSPWCSGQFCWPLKAHTYTYTSTHECNKRMHSWHNVEMQLCPSVWSSTAPLTSVLITTGQGETICEMRFRVKIANWWPSPFYPAPWLISIVISANFLRRKAYCVLNASFLGMCRIWNQSYWFHGRQ